MRGPARTGPRQGSPQTSRIATAIPHPFLAPTLGWVTGTNTGAAPEGSCHTLENWVPTRTGIRPRLGRQQHARCATGFPVQSLMAYVGGNDRQLFGAANGSIFDITAPADPDVAPAADLSGFTGNYWSFQNFASSGGNTMTIANGVDFGARQYDGAAWSTPSITNLGSAGAGNNTNTVLDHVWTYRNRLFFTEPNTMRAYCLASGAIAGAAVLVNLTGVFPKGGSLASGARWSLSAGSGLNENCVFISTEGEVAVYQGSDPADPNDWSLVGVYDIGPILGKRATVQRGGDLLMATEQGLIPISAAINSDLGELGLFAYSQQIEPDWKRDAAFRRGLPWEIVKWPSHDLAFVNTPVTGTSTDPWCYVVNTETGAWCKFTNWDTRCLVLHDDYVYFGDNDGTVMQAEVTGADDGAVYECRAGFAFTPLAGPGAYKTAVQARALFKISDDILPKLSISSDYVIVWPTAPNVSPAVGTAGVWDVALWDTGIWDLGASTTIFNTRWVEIGQSGEFSISVQVQVTCGNEAPPSAELVSIDLQYGMGGIVV